MSRVIVIEFVSLDGVMQDPMGDPGRVQGPGPVPRLRAERTWYTPRVKPPAQEPLAWLATAELIGVVCWLRPAELIGVVCWLRPAELIGVVCWLRPAELIGVVCWLRPAELIGIVCWLRPAEPVADFRSARAVRTCHLDLHHRYLYGSRNAKRIPGLPRVRLVADRAYQREIGPGPGQH